MNRLCIALLLWISLGPSPRLAAETLPAPPANGLRDDTRALPEKLQTELAQEIATGRSTLGMDIWFSAGTFLAEGQNIRTLARDLRQHWSPDKDAVLVNYDRASDTQSLSFSPGLWQRYPTSEIIALMQRNVAIMGKKSSPLEVRLAKSLRKMLQDLQTLEEQYRQSAVTLAAPHVRLATLFACGLGTGAMVLGLLGMATRRRDVQAAWQSFFPEVQVGTRLGALHGGGIIVEKDPHQGT